MSSSCGVFRATVYLARTAMEQSVLTRWSVDELAVFCTVYAGVAEESTRHGVTLFQLSVAESDEGNLAGQTANNMSMFGTADNMSVSGT